MIYEIFKNNDLKLFIKLLFANNRLQFNVTYSLLTKVRKDSKYFTIGPAQLKIVFKDYNDPFLIEMYDTIIDRLALLFEEYPSELEYTCDALLLEFHLVKPKKAHIANLQEGETNP